MADRPAGGYYAVIPAEVRYDQDLKPNAKLLYGELTALCNQSGYCWATNEYFADLYGLSVSTISRLITQLEQRGYIRTEMAATATGSERRIYAGAFVVQTRGSCQKEQDPLDEKSKRGLDENGNTHNRYNNTREYYTDNTPQSPPAGGGAEKQDKPKKRTSPYALQEDAKPVLRAYCTNYPELTRPLADLIEVRQAKKAINSRRAIKMLLEELDRLSGGSRANKLALLRRAIANSWKTVYPMRPEELPEKIQPGAVSAQAEGGGGDCGFR